MEGVEGSNPFRSTITLTPDQFREFLGKFPDPIAFEKMRDDFLKLKQIEGSNHIIFFQDLFNKFEIAIYGKKKEYWDQILLLKQNAEDSPKNIENIPDEAKIIQALLDSNFEVLNQANVNLSPNQRIEFLKKIASGDISTIQLTDFLESIPLGIIESDSSRLEFFDQIHQNRQMLAIIAWFNTGNISTRFDLTSDDLKLFFEKYKTPNLFEMGKFTFLNWIERRNGVSKRKEYEMTYDAFEKLVYGQRLDYWQVLQKLEAESLDKYNEVGKTITPEIRLERSERYNQVAEHISQTFSLIKEGKYNEAFCLLNDSSLEFEKYGVIVSPGRVMGGTYSNLKEASSMLNLAGSWSWFYPNISKTGSFPNITIGSIHPDPETPYEVRVYIEQNLALCAAEEWIHYLQFLNRGRPLAGYSYYEVDAAAYMLQNGVKLTPLYLSRYGRQETIFG